MFTYLQELIVMNKKHPLNSWLFLNSLYIKKCIINTRMHPSMITYLKELIKNKGHPQNLWLFLLGPSSIIH